MIHGLIVFVANSQEKYGKMSLVEKNSGFIAGGSLTETQLREHK